MDRPQQVNFLEICDFLLDLNERWVGLWDLIPFSIGPVSFLGTNVLLCIELFLTPIGDVSFVCLIMVKLNHNSQNIPLG
jgi:hypothetical protein